MSSNVIKEPWKFFIIRT